MKKYLLIILVSFIRLVNPAADPRLASFPELLQLPFDILAGVIYTQDRIKPKLDTF
jgi:hypothetical protein